MSKNYKHQERCSRVCIDIGGTKVLAAVVDADGAIVARHKEATELASPELLAAQVGASVRRVLKLAEAKKSSLAGIALGVPGVVRAGQVVLAPNVPLAGTDLRRALSDHYNVPVVVANDGSLGGLGEVALGAARGANSCYGIFVGTGIGGGLVLGGRLIEGARGLGGEVGHLLAPMWSRPDARDIGDAVLGQRLGLSALCSREGIEKYLRRAILEDKRESVLPQIVGDAQLSRVRSGALKKAMQAGDEVVFEALSRCSELLGVAAASVSSVVDPEVIVFGGGVIEACGEWMLPQIRRVAQQAALAGDWPAPRVEQSALGDDAILIGGWKMLRDV